MEDELEETLENENFKLTKEEKLEGIRNYIDGNVNPKEECEAPVIEIISGPVGAGKTSMEYLKRDEILKTLGKKPTRFNEDLLAQYYPHYVESIEQSSDAHFRTTRKYFVRPVFLRVCRELAKRHVNILNENVLDGNERDLNQMRIFKENGYKIHLNFIATPWLECRLSAIQRAAKQIERGEQPRGCATGNQRNMFNSSVAGSVLLGMEGLLDKVSIYKRPEKEGMDPIRVYETVSDKDTSYIQVIKDERRKETEELIKNPVEYLKRLNWSKEKFMAYSEEHPVVAKELIKQCDEVEREYLDELMKSLDIYLMQGVDSELVDIDFPNISLLLSTVTPDKLRDGDFYDRVKDLNNIMQSAIDRKVAPKKYQRQLEKRVRLILECSKNNTGIVTISAEKKAQEEAKEKALQEKEEQEKLEEKAVKAEKPDQDKTDDDAR